MPRRLRNSYKRYINPHMCNETIPRNTIWRRQRRKYVESLSRSLQLHDISSHSKVIPSTSAQSCSERDETASVIFEQSQVCRNEQEGISDDSSQENESEAASNSNGNDRILETEDYNSDASSCSSSSSSSSSSSTSSISSSSSNSEGSDENSSEEGGDNMFDWTFFNNDLPKAVMKGFDIFVMIVVFSIRHSLTYTATIDLFCLINTVFGEKVLPHSKYLYEKSMQKFFNCIKQHFYCKVCSSFIGCRFSVKEKHLMCPDCLAVFEKQDCDFFVTLTVKHQLRFLLERMNFEDSGNFVRCERENTINDICDGALYKQLKKGNGPLSNANNFSYIFNTDGAPIFTSSKSSFWPIFILLNELPPLVRFKNILLSGIYVGKTSPKMQMYMQTFVDQAKDLFYKGVVWQKNKTEKIRSKFIAVCCSVDSVARPLLQCTNQFNGYFGCGWCYHPGESIGNPGQVRYTMDENSYTDRNNIEMERDMELAFNSNRTHMGVKGPSVLLNLPFFGIVTGFVPDYMHCVCLGVVKYITNLWFENSESQYYIGQPSKIVLINQRLTGIKPPCGISRLPRDISDRKFWKASEWKCWLLYYSIPVLQNILCSKYLNHWATLVEAIYILLKDAISKEELNFADLLLFEFVFRTQSLYGKSYMTYNVHLLLHLAKSVSNWGPLWAFSTFAFESGNGQLLNFIKSSKGIEIQIAKRFLMLRYVDYVIHDSQTQNNTLQYCNDIFYYPVLKRANVISECVLLHPGNLTEELENLIMLNVSNYEKENLEIYTKVLYKSKKYHSEEYKRLKKRTDTVIVTTHGQYGSIKYFIKYNLETFILLRLFKLLPGSAICDVSSGAKASHLKMCEKSQNYILQDLTNIKQKCIIMEMSKTLYVSSLVNVYENE